MIPDFWKEFVETNRLVHREFELSEDDDISKIGAEFQIMSFEESRDEMENLYPGLVVKNDGFIPVGSCLIGSGDPYFINEKDGKNGGLYRIYHDSVLDENYDPKQSIHLVLNNYEEMLKKGV